jgi:hypothetical protein
LTITLYEGEALELLETLALLKIAARTIDLRTCAIADDESGIPGVSDLHTQGGKG